VSKRLQSIRNQRRTFNPKARKLSHALEKEYNLQAGSIRVKINNCTPQNNALWFGWSLTPPRSNVITWDWEKETRAEVDEGQRSWTLFKRRLRLDGNSQHHNAESLRSATRGQQWCLYSSSPSGRPEDSKSCTTTNIVIDSGETHRLVKAGQFLKFISTVLKNTRQWFQSANELTSK
jgi:hypothetical protein